MDSSSADSSGESTPEPPLPFSPKYEVNILDKVTKDGEDVKFTIQVTQDGLTVSVIERIYKDFEYLEHCVITDQPSEGLIIPPLPLQVAVDAQSAEAISKKQMGKSSKVLLGDDFSKDCLQLQRYIELLLSHPVLGKSPRLHNFLLNKDAPPRAKVRKSIIEKISESIDSRKNAYPDSEEFFQKERQWVALYSTAMDAFTQTFTATGYCQLRVSRQLEQMVIALRLNNCLQYSDKNPLLASAFIDSIDTYRIHIEKKCLLDELHTGSALQMWSSYIHSEASMLLRRTCLMVDYQSCNRALDKAKPNRKQEAEEAKKEAEDLFERCSDVARAEMKRFQHKRSIEMHQLIENFAHRQLASAKLCLNSLQTILLSLNTTHHGVARMI